MGMAIRIWACCVFVAASLTAQDAPGKQCAAAPETQAAFDALDALRDTTPYAQRIRQEREKLEAVRRQQPDDLWLHRRYVNLIRNEFAAEWPALRQAYVDAAAASPNDAVRAYLAGWVLEGRQTDKTIEYMERAKKLDPVLAFPHLTLSTNYSRGTFLNQAKAEENVTAYFRLCPDTSYSYAHGMLARLAPKQAQREIAAELRKRLEASSDPQKLRLFEQVWSLEFRSTPPQEHAALRERITKDLERLQAADVKPDGEWLAFLAKGYQQVNANSSDAKEIEDRLLTEFPGSPQAAQLFLDRERKEHPSPEATASRQEWVQWTEASLARRQAWLDRHGPDSLMLQLALLNYQAIETLTAEQTRLVQERLIKPLLERFGPKHYLLGRYIQFYFDNNLNSTQAAEWAELAHAHAKADMAGRLEQADYLNAKERQELEKSARSVIVRNLAPRLEAYRRLGDKDAALKLRGEIPAPGTGDPDGDYQIWALRAKLAEIEGHKADALAFYSNGLNTRPKEPPTRAGRTEDPLLDDARRLWNELGGTEEGWQTWRNAAKPIRELTEGRWEQPGKPLPPFELADLSGRSWKLQALEGKTVFLNLWATWCGPCQAELPHVQKLYETLKGRPEFEVLTLNIDEDLGLVQPYMDEKKLSFPVLPAYRYAATVAGALGLAIPQNWIVDGKGVWRWKQLGYNADTKDWRGEMVEKLEATAKE